MSRNLRPTLLIFFPIFFIVIELVVYFYATLGPISFAALLLVCIPLFVVNPAINLIVLMLALTFQSVLISIVSPFFEGRADLSLVQGLHFSIILATALVGVLTIGFNRKLRRDIGWDRLFFILWLIMLVNLFYLAYGVAKNGSVSAVIYFRNTTSVLLMVIIGWYLGAKLSRDNFLTVISAVLTAAVIYGLFEFFMTRSLYSLINADSFFRLKYEGRYDISGLEDVLEFAKRPFLNLAVLEEIGLTTFRLSGPNMHAISYAYICSFALVFFAINKAYVRMALSFFILLAIQAKGPLFVIVLAFIGLVLTRKKTSFGWPVYFGLNVVYSVAAFIIGTATRDFHVIGLMGGVLGFLRNPFGYGLGAGGNLAREEFSWSDAQNAGAAAFGVESAVGVLLYQVGIATFIFLFFYFRLSIWSENRMRSIPEISAYRIMPLMGIAIVFNGLFQEEAYNFFSLGFVFFFCMALIANFPIVRSVKASSHDTNFPEVTAQA
ncbi:hypothetical protein [Arenibacterium sp. LLYu02]|uniref:hypothetical protein n=1 Tax=Arenibacterium sp. LLYu02 TaxID=3404132 RepID=UPI003B21F300